MQLMHLTQILFGQAACKYLKGWCCPADEVQEMNSVIKMADILKIDKKLFDRILARLLEILPVERRKRRARAGNKKDHPRKRQTG